MLSKRSPMHIPSAQLPCCAQVDFSGAHAHSNYGTVYVQLPCCTWLEPPPWQPAPRAHAHTNNSILAQIVTDLQRAKDDLEAVKKKRAETVAAVAAAKAGKEDSVSSRALCMQTCRCVHGTHALERACMQCGPAS